MKIDISNGQFFYELFYQVSFLLVFLIYLIEGYNRKFPWSTWLLVIVTVRIFFITGSKFGAITQDDFSYFMQHFQFPAQHYTNLMGALLFGLIGVGFAKWLLRIRYPVLDAFAIAAPVGMAIQRIGCLMVGCCYGTETHVPWGIQYGVNTPAFLHQFISHQPALNSTLSSPIHPVPLYFIITSVIVAVTVIFLRHKFRKPGNLALFSLLLILTSRFFIEFFRDPESNGAFQGSYFLGLKAVQLLSLIAVILLTGIISFREKHVTAKVYLPESNHPLLNSSCLLLLSVLLYVTRNWFTDIEFYVLLIAFIPAILFVIRDLLTNYFTSRVRLSTLSLIAFSLLIMSQAEPSQKTTSWKTVRAGYSGGVYTTYRSVGMGTGCDRQQEFQYFRQKYQLGGIGYTFTRKDSLKVVEYGINGYVGSLSETGSKSNITTNKSIVGINPFIGISNKWFAGRFGLHIGDLRITPAYRIEDGTVSLPQTSVIPIPVYPQLYARVGIERIVYLSYHWGDQFPSPFPIMYNYLELGSGFGDKHGFKVSVGANIEGATLFKAEIPIMNKFLIVPMYQTGIGVNNLYGQNSPTDQFSIGLHYMFGYK